MKYLIWIIILFIAAAAITAAAHNQAYLLLVYPPYRIEFSLNLFICALILLFIFGYSLIRLTIATMNLPESVRQFRIKRNQDKARELLDTALYAFFEGRYSVAETAAANAMKLGDYTPFHAIIAARSAHELRNYAKRDAYLATIESEPGNGMRLIAQASFMLEQKDAQAALNALKPLGGKRHAGTLSIELSAQQQLGNWDEVLSTLALLEKQNAIEETVAEQLRQQAWIAKIRQQPAEGDLNNLLKNLPSSLKQNSRINAAAAQMYMQLGANNTAAQLISDSLAENWDSELVTLYGECLSDNIVTQIGQAEKWLKEHKNDAQLLLTLGKLCLQQSLWGKAQSYLDASISMLPSCDAYNTLGKLAEKTGKSTEAEKYFQQAILFKQLGTTNRC